MFQGNKDTTYSRDDVDVRLANGLVIKARAAKGGWMGPTALRPYPDFQEVNTDSRISRIQLYMAAAHLFSKRSTCLRGQVGCVAVKNGHIIAAGYNGSPPGMPHCLDVGCGGGVPNPEFRTDLDPDIVQHVDPFIYPNGCTRTIHAEANMVAFAARVGTSLEGCVVFSTHGPCLPCAQVLVASRILSLHYRTPYRLPQGLALLDEANIAILQQEEM